MCRLFNSWNTQGLCQELRIMCQNRHNSTSTNAPKSLPARTVASQLQGLVPATRAQLYKQASIIRFFLPIKQSERSLCQ